MEGVENDDRFAHTLKDPRFRRPHIKQKKIKIDARFKSMLKDKEFSQKVTVDKRGRPITTGTSTKENLERLYDYESDEDDSGGKEEDSNDSGEEGSADDLKESKVNGEESSADDDNEEESGLEEENDSSGEPEGVQLNDVDPENDDTDSDSEEDIPAVTDDGPDYARGGGTLESSSDEEEDDENIVDGEAEKQGILDHHWNEPDREAPEAADITHRLALCNMDWDRIKARDLYVLFNSFVPQGGALRSVTIYLSQTGKEKLAEEEARGPSEFREGKATNDAEMGELNRAKLRRYQLNRLKYYYAVIEFDNKESANAVYEECDSMEYEKSSCRVDLRFIPDDMTFDETAKESCTGLSDLATFEPSSFTSTAFCQANVQVTWDETNIDRLRKTMRQFTEEDIEKDDFDELVASSEDISSVDEEEIKKGGKKKATKFSKKKAKKYRKLLGLDDSDKKSKKKKKKSKKISKDIGDESDDDDNDSDEQEKSSDAKAKKKKKTKDKKSKEVAKEDDASGDDEEAEEGEGDMEFTWEPAADKQKLKKKSDEKLTPWAEYQRKQKEKKRGKRRDRKKEKLRQQGAEDTAHLGFDDPFFDDKPEEAEGKKKKKQRRKNKAEAEEEVEENEDQKKEKAALGLLMKDDDDHLNHFSLEKIMKEEKDAKRKKAKKRKESGVVAADTFEIKVDQSRFGGLYSNPEMHIDPNAPEFKKTKAMSHLMEEVTKRRKKHS